MEENANALTPKFSVTFIVLIVFSILCSFVTISTKNGCQTIDWISSKPSLAFAGVVSAGMAIVTGMGGILLTGLVQYNPIVAVMPFLVICKKISTNFFA